jgi:hypothetical protein
MHFIDKYFMTRPLFKKNPSAYFTHHQFMAMCQKIQPNEWPIILKYQQLIKTILSHCIESPPVIDSQPISFDDILAMPQKKCVIYIEPGTHALLLSALQDLEIYQTINPAINACIATFKQKLITDITPQHPSVWTTLNQWLTNALFDYIDTPMIQIPSLRKNLTMWVHNIKKTQRRELAIAIRTLLHSKVNQEIISTKIMGKNGWQHRLHTNHSDQKLSHYTHQLQTDIEALTTAFHAPFMARFSQELLDRCYAKLAHPPKPSPPTSNDPTITSITPDIVPHTPLSVPRSDTYLSLYHDIYKEILRHIVSSPPDIRHLVKTDPTIQTILTTARHLPSPQRLEFNQKYHQLIQKIRQYETQTLYWQKKSSLIFKQPLTRQLRWLGQSLEASIHRYRPYVIDYFYYLNHMARHEKKNNPMGKGQSLSEWIHITNQIYDDIQGINTHMARIPRMSMSNIPNKSMNEITQLIQKTLTPWVSFDWRPVLDILFMTLNLKKSRPQRSRLTPSPTALPHQLSHMVTESPPPPLSSNHLDEYG